MTRKDYREVATIIKSFRIGSVLGRGSMEFVRLEDMENELMRWFARDNPRFDSVRFLEASGGRHA